MKLAVWLAVGTFATILGIAGLYAVIHKLRPDHTVTVDGTVWHCNQVNEWRTEYAQMTPEGRPIPAVVIFSCIGR